MAKRRTGKTLIVFISLLLACSSLCSQLVLIPEIQTGGVILKQQVWSLVLNNLSPRSRKVVLYINITDRLNARPMLEASSNVIVLNTGVKKIMYNDLAPVNYSIASVGFGMDRQLNQPIPVGEYIVCYKLIDIDDKNIVLANECVKIAAEPLSPPQLVLPENQSVLTEPRPVLTWTPPAPIYMFSDLSYDIIVSPIYDKQSPAEAIQRNLPVMTTRATTNSILYPPSYTNLIPGKTYAWQVVAKEGERFGGKSEAWTFTVMPDSVVRIVSAAPFIKLEKDRASTTVLQQGVLKMEYFNSTGDSMVKVEVYRVSEPNGKRRQALSFQLKVGPGQNFLEHRIQNRMRLDENSIYEVKLYNNRNEHWYMKFKPRYYF
jgi:hypothetical protein